MCTASLMDRFGTSVQTPGQKAQDKADPTKVTAADVPLGEGLADAARTSILGRRERIRQALEAAGE